MMQHVQKLKTQKVHICTRVPIKIVCQAFTISMKCIRRLVELPSHIKHSRNYGLGRGENEVRGDPHDRCHDTDTGTNIKTARLNYLILKITLDYDNKIDL